MVFVYITKVCSRHLDWAVRDGIKKRKQVMVTNYPSLPVIIETCDKEGCAGKPVYALCDA